MKTTTSVKLALRLSLLIIFFSLSEASLKASHLLGGAVTWECLPGGAYKFRLTVYRDCSGVPMNSTTETLSTNAGGTITCTKIATNYLNKECNAPSCLGATFPYVGGVEEHIYESGPITLTGTPPATGWYFYWQNCCRPSMVSNLASAASTGYTFAAQIFSSNMGTCMANSPQFLENPNPVICTSTQQSIVNTAFDLDGDSLYYKYVAPFDDGSSFPPPLVSFASGYSAQSPFPQSANAQLDHSTGMISINNAIQGVFTYGIVVEKWRNGQLIGEVYRELPVFAKSCTPPPGICGGTQNLAPSVSFQWLSGYDTLSPVYTGTNTISYYEMEVNSGTPIKFIMSALDAQVNANCTPQLVNFYGESPYLSSAPSYNGSGNCKTGVNCAEVVSLNANGGFNATASNSVEFNWVPNCSNFNPTTNIGLNTRTFDFYFEFFDDGCPYPMSRPMLIRIKVNSSPSLGITASSNQICQGDSVLLSAPAGYANYMWATGQTTPNIYAATPGWYTVTCTDNNACVVTDSIEIGLLTPYTQAPEICLVTFDETVGYNSVVWEKPSKKGVKAYLVYRYLQTPPMQLLDTVGVNDLSSYVDSSVGANAQAWSYYIALLDSCGIEYGTSITSHTTIWLTASQPIANQVALNWTPYVGVVPSRYIIYRKDQPNASYTKLDSVSNQVTYYIDSLLPTGNGFSYKIGAVLDSGCVATYKTNAETNSNVVAYASIGLLESALKDQLNIYPNPTTGMVQLSMPVNGSYKIFTMRGELLETKAIQGINIDLSALPMGLYVVEIVDDKAQSAYFRIQKL